MFQTSFSYSDYGYGATIAVLLTVICLLVTLALFRWSRTELAEG
jgi:multiple sugar transport system permease protein/raffinose/stachyose/melibiose transport system permease protein